MSMETNSDPKQLIIIYLFIYSFISVGVGIVSWNGT